MSALGLAHRAALLPAGNRGAAAGGARHRARGGGGFLNPRLRDLLPDPSQFKDMDKAAERLARAVEAGEGIAVFGDYDVDGATSAALAFALLRRRGAGDPRLHSRPHEGRLWAQSAGACWR